MVKMEIVKSLNLIANYYIYIIILHKYEFYSTTTAVPDATTINILLIVS